MHIRNINMYYIIIILILFTDLCFGYIDPGSTSFLLQLLLGAIASLLYSIKIYWYKIKSYFPKNVNDKNKN